jgi:integrase
LPAKITEILRATLLRRPLVPSLTRDADIPGLALTVTSRRAFWCLLYQPRGVNPATGKRWGGGVRYELGDARLMPVWEAQAAALAAKSLVRVGRSPHHEAMASRASLEARRAIVPTTVDEALDLYGRVLMSRSRPSERTRRQSVRYARLACRLMNAGPLPLVALGAPAIRLLTEVTPGSDSQRRHVYGGLNRFLVWSRKQGLLEINPCDALDRSDRPKPGKARAHVPELATLRGVWAAVEAEPAHVRDLIRFLLLVPLRRSEASELTWSEVDFDRQPPRLVIGGARMKNGEMHELPLSGAAIALLKGRSGTEGPHGPDGPAASALVFPTTAGKPHANWGAVLTRIRKAIGESERPRDLRFSLHDIRRGFVSHLAERFDIDALDQVLAHKRSGVAAVYQRSRRMDARAEALAAWAALLLDEARPDSNVVPFARANVP